MGFLTKDSDFMKYMRRDGRWISFLNALAIAGITFFLIAMLSYAIAGITSYVFCVTLLVFSVLFMIPGFMGLLYLRREKKIKEGKIIPKEKLKPALIQPTIASPVVDGEHAPVIPRSQDPFFADIDAPKKTIVEEIKEKEREERRIAELEQKEQKILEEQARKQAIIDEQNRIREEKIRAAQEAKERALAEKQRQKEEKAQKKMNPPQISKTEQEALDAQEKAEEEALLAGLQLYRSMAQQNQGEQNQPL